MARSPFQPIPDTVGEELTLVAAKVRRARARLTPLEVERDTLILEAVAAGASARRIAEAAGVSHTHVYNLIDRIDHDNRLAGIAAKAELDLDEGSPS